MVFPYADEISPRYSSGTSSRRPSASNCLAARFMASSTVAGFPVGVDWLVRSLIEG